MKNKEVDQSFPVPGSLYRLPFSKNDNPNGWLEITDHCNMECPGCYRGCHRDDYQPTHQSFTDIKNTIDKLVEIRNCSVISISGGEPLLHPDIEKIISFIQKRGLKSVLLTNGRLLTPKLITNLKKVGLTGIVIRVDTLREPGNKTEQQLNELREKYAQMVYREGLFFGLTCVLDKTNLTQAPDIVHWAQENAARVSMLLFILKRQVIFDKRDTTTNGMIAVKDAVQSLLQSLPGLKFNSYLGSQAEDYQPKWLISSWISFNGSVLGYLDKKFIEFSSCFYHLKTGKYHTIISGKDSRFSFFKLSILALFNAGIRNILGQFIKRLVSHPDLLLKKANYQTLLLVNPPQFVDGKRDFCDACPDAVLFKGRLVPSCILEEFKRFGGPVSQDALERS
ncbi:MAG: radical SAM protein [Fibrobacteria bacterium]|nr:radical SAM protein [Fibrobacteria bacterium]